VQTNQSTPKMAAKTSTATIRIYHVFGTRQLAGSVFYRGNGPHTDFEPSQHRAMDAALILAKRMGYTHYRLHEATKRYRIEEVPTYQELAASIS
jgi:hypothetical protein